MTDVTEAKELYPGSAIAVIGAGAAGLTAGYLLSQRHRVTVYEADDRLGGHAHTQVVKAPDGGRIAIDTGFIVHNDRTYPTLLKLFGQLGIATGETDMSMSVRSQVTGLEYAGALGVAGLFPTWRNLTRGRFLLMLAEIKRFHKLAQWVLDDSVDDRTLDEFATDYRLSRYFQENFLFPLVAAVWSCDAATAKRYPARYLFTFLDHHGMLSVYGSPSWRTVTGGSATYVTAVATHIEAHGGSIALSSPVSAVTSTGAGVDVATPRGTEHYDAAVIATHPHQALAMLATPTPVQREVLGHIGYARKPAVLHTDESLLPRARRARASWNYQIRADGSDVAVTYDLTRLMRLPHGDGSAGIPRYLVTMGRTDLVEPDLIVASMSYEHPVYERRSVAAQRRLPEIGTETIAFAGAYHGWGFHEDAAASGERAARCFGGVWPGETESLSASADR
ncbi:NAD(P)/FAD-dependent oxidoreductase [Gordonia sp. (in: high G+C Gram-positive bacteria)]|uniref:NAD(P)/FAD-dependent oxidoreductase n=3 Tax=Gordonia sp. (in: high G+C Gram-positive bacteria) TaxID=84139 RepID=UPI00352846DB